MTSKRQRNPIVVPTTEGSHVTTSPATQAETAGKDDPTDSDLDDASDYTELSMATTPPEVLLEQNWKRYRLRARKNQGHSAVRSLVRCLALTRIVHGDATWRRAQVHLELAKSYLDLRDMPLQAVKHSQMARDVSVPMYRRARDVIREAGNGDGSSDDHLSEERDGGLVEILNVLAPAQFVLGKAFCGLGKYSDGEVALVKADQYAAELQRSTSHPNLTTTVEINKALGLCCLKQKKTRVAHDYLDKAEKLATKLYGEEAVQLIDIHQNIGKARQQESDLEGAIEEYSKSHSIAVARNGQHSESAAGTLHSLATAYLTMEGSDAETVAEGYLNDCLATYERLHGPRNQKTIQIQEELCRLMLRTDRHKEAVEQISEVIAAKRAVYGDPSEELASTYKLLGTVYLSEGHLEKAVHQFQKSHGMFGTVLGPRHKRTVNVQQTIEMLSRSSTGSAAMRGKSLLDQRPRFKTIVK